MCKVLNCFTILLLAGIVVQGHSQKVRLCVISQVELNKCNDMNEAAQKHNLAVQFECSLDLLNDCVLKTKAGKSDAVIVDGHKYAVARAQKLVPVLFEAFGEDNVMVALADPDMTNEQMKDTAVEYNEKDIRAVHAAMYLNLKRHSPVCDGLKAGKGNTIKVIKSSDLENYKNTNMKLICPTLERKSLTEYKNCHIEANLVTAVFVTETHNKKDDVISAFKSVVEHFGPSTNNDFKIFGKYKEDNEFHNENVLFSDDANNLLDKPELPNGVDEKAFDKMHCHGALSHDEHHH